MRVITTVASPYFPNVGASQYWTSRRSWARVRQQKNNREKTRGLFEDHNVLRAHIANQHLKKLACCALVFRIALELFLLQCQTLFFQLNTLVFVRIVLLVLFYQMLQIASLQYTASIPVSLRLFFGRCIYCVLSRTLDQMIDCHIPDIICSRF